MFFGVFDGEKYLLFYQGIIAYKGYNFYLGSAKTLEGLGKFMEDVLGD